MPKPEPTWAQKAQACQAELEGCQDQLERFKGMERELTQVRQELEQRVNSSPDLTGLTKKIEFYKREAITAQQREATLQGRVQRLENALRQAPTTDLVESLSDALAVAKEDARRAAQQAQEARAQLAGTQQRLQQFQGSTEALRAMEQAVDLWQRKATQFGRENDELRQQVSTLPELRAELEHVTGKLRLASEHIQRGEARLAEAMPAVRALPSVKADLAQANTALDRARREAVIAARQRDEAQAEIQRLRSTLADVRGRLG